MPEFLLKTTLQEYFGMVKYMALSQAFIESV